MHGTVGGVVGQSGALLAGGALWVATVEYDLTVAQQQMNCTGYSEKQFLLGRSL